VALPSIRRAQQRLAMLAGGGERWNYGSRFSVVQSQFSKF
jgi:hypothetical protein